MQAESYGWIENTDQPSTKKFNIFDINYNIT